MKKIYKILITMIVLVILIGIGWRLKPTKVDTRILIVGDSIGAGAGCHDIDRKWFKLLVPYFQKEFGEKLEITNVSMGGNTSYAGYARLRMLETTYPYEYVVVCYGENDVEEDFPLYYESILHTIKNQYPESKILTILESSQRTYTSKMQTIIELSAYYGAEVVDMIKVFEESGYEYEMLSDDGCHPNDLGQSLYYEAVSQCIGRLHGEDIEVHTAISPKDSRMVEFKNFLYVEAEQFQKKDDKTLAYEGVLPAGRLAIDYSPVQGEHQIHMILDNQELCDKNISWEAEFTQPYIEIVESSQPGGSNLLLQFSSEAQMKQFHGIIISGE